MVENTKIPPKIIIDASIALSFLLPDEKDTIADKIFRAFQQNKTVIITSQLFFFEVGNSLKSAILQKRISYHIAKKLLEKLIKTTISQVAVNWQQTLDFAVKHKISFYDASYLLLAKQEKVRLYTLDKKLGKLV